MKSHWITYHGHRVHYCDLTDLGHSDYDLLKAELNAVIEVLLREPKNSVLSLCDVRKSVATSQAVRVLKRAATKTAPHVRKQAAVGVVGLKGAIFDAVVRVSGQNARAFGDFEMDEAKEWLVKGED